MNLENYLSSSSIIFYIILVNTRLLTSLERFSQKLFADCLKTECKCVSHLEYDTIDCPATDSKLDIVVEPSLDKVILKCYNLTAKEFLNLVPHLSIGMSEIVGIMDCPLPPDNVAIATVLHKLEITNYTSLRLYIENNNTTPISRQHLSDLYGLNELTLNISSLQTALPEDVFSDISLANLTVLDIFSNSIKLPSDVLKSLPNLDSLSISAQSDTMTSRLFLYQRKLRYLYLIENNLNTITNTIFQSLDEIQLLSLNDNNIEVVEPNAFDGLKNLIEISLNENKITSLPANLFRYNKLLEVFELANNKVPMEKVASKLLADLPHLNYVILKCGLNEIPADLFANSVNIETIILADNKLETLPETLFKSQLKIIDINVSNNRLRFLPDNLLRNTKNLTTLKLSNNELVKISQYNFEHLKGLQQLDLSHNQLTFEHIRFGVDYRYNLGLKILNLDYNNIEHIPLNMPGYMDTLYLAHNNITILNADDLFSLRFYKMQANLSYNQIQTINFDNIKIIYALLHSQLSMILNNNPINCDCNLISFIQFLRGEKEPKLLESLQFHAYDLLCNTPDHLKGKNVKQLNPKELLCQLDRNQCPIKCNCWIRSFDQMLIVNCSNSKLTSVPVLPIIGLLNLTGIELDLENNLLEQLPLTNETKGYANVIKLFVAGNNIYNIERIHLPRNLIYLDLRRNNLSSLETLIFTNKSKYLQQILLSANPWKCDCEALPLLRFIQSNIFLFKDSADMICANTAKLKYFYELQDLCPDELQIYIILALILCAFGLLLASVIALYYKYEEELKIWLYAHNMCLWFVTEQELDRNKKYDAFISYSSRDEGFIFDYLIPELENGSPPFKLCVHERDWHIGEFIPDQIVRSVADSRRTIVVLSQNFIDSVWAKMEFKAAHTSALYERRSRIIVIIYGDIGDIDRLDKDLILYIKMNTYLKWGDSKFWEKLRYAMPHSLRIRNGRQLIPLRDIINDITE